MSMASNCAPSSATPVSAMTALDVRHPLRRVVARLEHRDRPERLARRARRGRGRRARTIRLPRACTRSRTSRTTNARSPGWLGRSAPEVPPGASLHESGNVGAATTYPALTQWSVSPDVVHRVAAVTRSRTRPTASARRRAAAANRPRHDRLQRSMRATPSYGPFAGVGRDSSTSVNEIRSIAVDVSFCTCVRSTRPDTAPATTPMSDCPIVRR